MIWLRKRYSDAKFRNGLTLSWSYGPIVWLQLGDWRGRLRVVFDVQSSRRGPDNIAIYYRHYGQPYRRGEP
jgi:hypothetical protein